MIDTKEFVSFIEQNFDFISGVPCSYYKQLLNYLAENEESINLNHVLATREDEAVGIASGVVLSGKRAVVYLFH